MSGILKTIAASYEPPCWPLWLMFPEDVFSTNEWEEIFYPQELMLGSSRRANTKISGTKKEHKPKLLSQDIFRWGGCLPCEGVGAKKFGMPLETREIKLFFPGYPGILPGYPGGDRKVWEKKACAQFSSPKISSLISHETLELVRILGLFPVN